MGKWGGQSRGPCGNNGIVTCRAIDPGVISAAFRARLVG